MRVVNQRSDIDMGNMPTQLISGPYQIAVGGPSAVRANEGAAGSFAVLMAVRAGRTRVALTCPDDFEMTLGLVLNLASLLAILPHPIALALRLAAWSFGDALRLA